MELRHHRWKYHIILFAVIVSMFLFGEYVNQDGDSFVRKFSYPYFFYIITFFIPFYATYFLNYTVVCSGTIAKRKIILFIIAILFLILLHSGIRYFLEEIVLFRITGIHNYDESSRNIAFYIVDNSYYAIQAILYSSSLYLLFEYLEHKEKIHTLQLEHKKAELSLLKTQLEPHFLFNTLNTFYTELVDVQPETAKDIHRLSQLLRYVTYETHHDFMPLQRELQFVSDYIYFQKKRFEDNLFLDYEVEGIIGQQRILSLALIHFIENVFKHGILNDKTQPAQIRITITNIRLELRSSNAKSVSEHHSNKGIGEDNLRDRLDALYTDNYTLNFEQDENQFQAYLSIPIS